MAVIFGSSCRKLPAAALRGLANGGSPDISRSAFKDIKSDLRMNTSPLTSSNLGMERLSFRRASGIALMVFKFAVMSSPLIPSPRVDPLTNAPFS